GRGPSGRLRRGLRRAQCGAAVGPPRAGPAAHRVPHAPAGRRPPVRPATGRAAGGPPRPAAEVGAAPAAAAPGRPLAGGLADRPGLALRALAERPLEGGRLSVVG